MKWFAFVLVIVALFTIISKVGAPTNTLKIGDIVLNIEIADTAEERELGLSGREPLAMNEGLLFVFEKEGKYGFWMKDMNFPIDIVWIDRDKKIIHIESNVSPDSYPKVFYPTLESLFVLETRAGFFEENKIEIGDLTEF